MHALYQSFCREQERAAGDLSAMAEMIQEGRIPPESLQDSAEEALRRLRGIRRQMAELLRAEGGEAEISADDADAGELLQRWEARRAETLKEPLRLFLRVTSERSRYLEALAPLRQEAERLLNTDAPDTGRFAAFLAALKAVQADDDEGIDRAEQELGDLPKEVFSGLFAGRYYLADAPAAEQKAAEEAPQAAAESAPSGPIEEPSTEAPDAPASAEAPLDETAAAEALSSETSSSEAPSSEAPSAEAADREDEKADQKAEHQADQKAADPPESADVEDTAPADGQTQAGWADFAGYPDGWRAEFRDVPASQYRRAEYESLPRRRDACSLMVHCCEKRACPMAEDGSVPQMGRKQSRELLPALRKRGYTASGKLFSPTGEVSLYLLPSHKWYAAMGRDVVPELKRSKLSADDQAYLHEVSIVPEAYTALYLLRCRTLLRWLEKHPEELLCSDRVKAGSSDPEYLYLLAQAAGKRSLFVVPAWLERGRENAFVDILTDALTREDDFILLLTARGEDRVRLTGAVCEEHPEWRRRLLFQSPEDAGPTDADGRPVNLRELEALEDGQEDHAEAEQAEVPAGEAGQAAEADAPQPEPSAREDAEDAAPEEPAGEDEAAAQAPPPAETARGEADRPALPDWAAVQEEKQPAPEDAGQAPHVLAADEREQLNAYLREVYRSLVQGRKEVAAVLLASLSQYDASLLPLVSRLQMATDDPCGEDVCTPSKLQAAFPEQQGQDPLTDALCAAAYLRMYFSRAAGEEPYLSRDIGVLEGNLSIVRHPLLGNVLYALSGWVDRQQRGLDHVLLGVVLQQQTVLSQAETLKKRAENLLGSRLTESIRYSNIIKKTRELLFGNNSELHRILEAIRDNDQTLAQKAEDWISRSVDDIIDETWRQARSMEKKHYSEDCKANERKMLNKQITEIQHLITDWLRLKKEADVSDDQSSRAQMLIAEVQKTMEALCRELTPFSGGIEEQAGEAVLLDAVRECLERVRGAADKREQRRRYYIRLLEQPLVVLQGAMSPYVETPEEEIAPFDFCARAVRYLAQEEAPDWNAVQERMFDYRSQEHLGMDYGSLRVLNEYLLSHGGSPLHTEAEISAGVRAALSRDNPQHVQAVHLWDQDFDAQLEMAEADGWLEDARDFYQRLLQARKVQYQIYVELTENLGCYGRALNRMIALLRERARGQRGTYQRQLDTIMRRYSEEELKLPIFRQIQEMIDTCRFAAAESFLGVLATNGPEVLDDSSLRAQTLLEFIGQLPALTAEALLSRRKRLANTFEDMNNAQQNRDIRTGLEMLKAWPDNPSNRSLSEHQLRTLLGRMDLPVKDVVFAQEHRQYTVTFRQTGDASIEYPHPMAPFGSQMLRLGLDVCWYAGNFREADDLFNQVSAMLNCPHGKGTAPRPLLILMDSAISLPNRRALAYQLNHSGNRQPMLLLDRSLALYLAGKPQSERWKALLRCAMPFRLLNPYVEGSSDPIPPEMFIGRKDIIQDIISPKGANLIYGGRQLGKTAIFYRAKDLCHKPDTDRFWAVYVDLKGKNSRDAVDRITRELRYQGFFPQEAEAGTWRELLDMIERRMMAPECREDKLLLLMDEMDALMREFADNRYQVFSELKGLQLTTGNRFKFVMAGLYSLLRFGRDALGGNSTVPQFTQIVIKPMDFTEARELLELPLSYLGFRIAGDSQDVIAQILHYTNYFPGLIQFYASRLVRYIMTNANKSSPPYELDRSLLLRMLGDAEFNKLRKERMMMTLTVDEDGGTVPYYYILALSLALCCHLEDEKHINGATARDIRVTCEDFGGTAIFADKTDEEVASLLDELVGLNMLRRDLIGNEKRYFFRRASFMEMLGNENQVMDELGRVLQGRYSQ